MRLYGLLEKLTKLVFSNSGNTTEVVPTATANRTITLPDADTDLVGDDTAQTLTSKTIDGDDNTVQDLPDTALKTNVTNANKFFTRDGSGVPTSAAKDVPTGDVVGTSDAQTLTGKTIVAASNTVTTAASGNLTSTELNAALAELQGDIDTKGSDLTNHEADTTTHGTTGNIVGTSDSQILTNKTIQASVNTITTAASGNLTSTELNSALAELQSDIDTRATSSALTTHEGDTSTHGVGEIVGSSELQELTNKDINGGTASNTSRITVPKAAKATLDGLARKEGTIVWASDEKKAYIDDGTSLVSVGGGGLEVEFKAANFTAEPQKEYVLTSDMTAITFPAGTDLDVIQITKDRAGGVSWESSNVTITPNGAETIDGDATFVLDTDSADFLYFVYRAASTNWISVTPVTPSGSAGGGGLVPTAIDHTNLPLTAESGKFYLVDMSGATGDETLTLPDIALLTESIGIQLVDAHTTHALIIAADASDTVDGATQLALRNKSDWRIANAQSASNWSTYRASSGNGAMITEWQSYTPTNTQGFGTIVSKLRWRQVGSSVEVMGDITTGTVTGSEAQIELPNSYTIKMDATAPIQVGRFLRATADSANYHTVLAQGSETYFKIGRHNNSSNINPLVADTGANLIGNSERASFHAKVEVSELQASGVTVTLNDLTARTKTVDDSVFQIVSTSSALSTPITTVARASGMSWRDSDGNYWMNIEFTGDSSSTTAAKMKIAGITLAGAGGRANQAFGVTSGGQAEQAFGYVNGSTSEIFLQKSSTADTSWTFTATFRLTGKPTWFDANVENSQSIDAQVGTATATTPGLVNPTAGDNSQQVFAGTYAPAVGLGTNAQSAVAIADFNYTRIGNMVTIAGELDINVFAAATTTVVTISVPPGLEGTGNITQLGGSLSSTERTGTSNYTVGGPSSATAPGNGLIGFRFERENDDGVEAVSFIVQYKIP